MENMLNEQQMAELQAILDADAANPPAMEENPEMEEAAGGDEVDAINDTVEGMSEGDGQAADAPVEPDPNPQAAAEAAQAAMPQLPDGFADVNQLIEAYEALKSGQGDVQAYRDMTAQLVATAEALGYGQGLESVPLEFDASTPDGAAKKEVHKLLGPMLKQQEDAMRQKMIDISWRGYTKEHEGELKDMMEDIKAIMDETPDLSTNERGLEIAHQLARAKRYRPESALLEDEAFIEKAISSPKIRDRIIEDYLKQVAKGGEDAVKGVTTGGSMASSGAKKAPKTMEAAKEGLLKLLGK